MKKKVLLTALLLSALSINGHAYGAERVVNGANITGTYENITVNENGGAVNNSISSTIQNAVFNSNKSTVSYSTTNPGGGAIFVKGNGSGVITDVINSQFDGNKADSACGGAIHATESTLNIVGSTFENNTAAWYGAVSTGTTTTLSISGDTVFDTNSALAGGALGVFSKAELKDVKFINNHATAAADDGGGAMFVGSEGAIAILDNVTFTGNTSAATGGAIGTRVGQNNNNSAAILNITNSTFEGNSAAKTGGAIDNHFYAAGNGITNSTFTNNSAKDGGAIYNHGDKDNQGNAAKLNITGGLFEGNKASVSGGAIYTESDAVITGATFNKNEINSDTAYSGGAIFVDAIDKTVNVTNSTFTNNKALNSVSYDSDGSAMSVKNGTVNIIGSTFENNVADQGTINQETEEGSHEPICRNCTSNGYLFAT